MFCRGDLLYAKLAQANEFVRKTIDVRKPEYVQLIGDTMEHMIMQGEFDAPFFEIPFIVFMALMRVPLEEPGKEVDDPSYILHRHMDNVQGERDSLRIIS